MPYHSHHGMPPFPSRFVWAGGRIDKKAIVCQSKRRRLNDQSELYSDVSSALTALASLIIDWILVIAQQSVEGDMAIRVIRGCHNWSKH